jgi:hypothetical protein
MRRSVRLLCQEIDWCHAATAGGPVLTRHKTFEVELPEDAAQWLSEFEPDTDRTATKARYIEAVELIEPKL